MPADARAKVLLVTGASRGIGAVTARLAGAGGIAVCVNVSSAAAGLGSPGDDVAGAASKAAIDAFTIGLSKEVATEGIRVNAVRPGIVHAANHASGGQPDRIDRITRMVPMLRGGQPHEVAHAVSWLLSDEASYTTGALVDVAGASRQRPGLGTHCVATVEHVRPLAHAGRCGGLALLGDKSATRI